MRGRAWGVRGVLVVGALTTLATSPAPTYELRADGEDRLRSGAPRTLTVTISKGARPHSDLTLSFRIEGTPVLQGSKLRITPQGFDLEPLELSLHCTLVRGPLPPPRAVSVQALLGDDGGSDDDGGFEADDAGHLTEPDAGGGAPDAAVVAGAGGAAGSADAGNLPPPNWCTGEGDYLWEPLRPLCPDGRACTLAFELELIAPTGPSLEATLTYSAGVTRSDASFGWCQGETISDYPKGAHVRVGLDE
jgi:hypothetical protein